MSSLVASGITMLVLRSGSALQECIVVLVSARCLVEGWIRLATCACILLQVTLFALALSFIFCVSELIMRIDHLLGTNKLG